MTNRHQVAARLVLTLDGIEVWQHNGHNHTRRKDVGLYLLPAEANSLELRGFFERFS